jgi:hypothetical protein
LSRIERANQELEAAMTGVAILPPPVISVWMRLILYAVHAFGLGFILAWIFPILFGHPSTLSLSDLIEVFGSVLSASIMAVVALFIVGLIPFIGPVVYQTNSMTTFAMGTFIVYYLAEGYISQIVARAPKGFSPYPQFWELIGYALIVGVFYFLVKWVFVLIFHLTRSAASRTPEETFTWREGVSAMILSTSFQWLAGIVPVFMWAAYVTLSLANMPR